VPRSFTGSPRSNSKFLPRSSVEAPSAICRWFAELPPSRSQEPAETLAVRKQDRKPTCGPELESDGAGGPHLRASRCHVKCGWHYGENLLIRPGKLLAFGAFVMCGSLGCGGGPTVNPTPIVSTISPEDAVAGGPAFQLNVVALNVETTSVVNWNGSPRTTTTDPNTGQLVAQIMATDITTPGVADITVVTPAPGGGISNDITFFIDAPANPAPVISGLAPSSATAGGAAFTLSVNGSGFVSSSSVNWNGSPRTTTVASSTQLTAAILATDILTAGTANVTVTNPAPGGGTSASAPFTISSGPTASASQPALFALVSVSASGEAGNGPSGEPRMDQSGRFVAFESAATNLLQSGVRAGVFLRDTCVGASNCAPETTAMDIARGGAAPNGGSGRGLAISANGRYVAFSSLATNLVSGQFHAGPQIYLRDTCFGAAAGAKCSPSTNLISVGLNGAAGDAASEFPSLSADGRYVAFASAASNLVAGADGGVPQIYLRDTCFGSSTNDCVPHTILISADPAGRPGKGASLQASISRDGRYVAFDSVASNLAAGIFSGRSNIFLRDTCLGASAESDCTAFTAVVSVNPDGLAANGASFGPAISGDGRYVTFASRASNAANGDTSRAQKIVVRDTCLNVSAAESCAPQTTLVSSAAFGDAHSPSISTDGRFITYVTDDGSSSLGALRIYLHDSCAGGVASSACIARTTLIASSGPGKRADLAGGKSWFGAPVSLDGNVIALFSTGPVNGFKGNLSGAGDVLVGILPAVQ
jgi:Tol biopolymer transport system component